MANVVVVGAQWGDEGKGKIVDWLSVAADVVVRFQGGHNAGHTLVIDGKVFKLALLPSGIVRPGKLSVIGNGVVLDPYHLVEEIEKLRGEGVEVTPDNLKIAENVPLILSLHRELDAHRESATRAEPRSAPPSAASARPTRTRWPSRDPPDGSSPNRTHSTTRSIGCSLTMIRCGGASDSGATRRGHSRRIGCGRAQGSAVHGRDVRNSRLGRRAGKRILFEGAQGAILDVDHGTYPYVTSSNTVAANAATGSGLGPRAIGYVLGIAKAYTTRVGGGPFPDRARQRHRALDWRTRQRVRHQHRAAAPVRLVRRRARASGVHTSGIDGIALTKLDILDGFETIKVATHYRLDGEEIDYLPAGQCAQAR